MSTSSAIQTRTMEEVVAEIMRRLGSLQNVLYHHSAPQQDVQLIGRDVALLSAALREADEMLVTLLMANIEMTEQRDAALKAVQAQRAEWIRFAGKQERRVIAAGVALDREEIDAEMVEAALDYIVGARRGDASEGAQWDVARALQRLGDELNQKGV